jgi:uncharacterized membrane protein
MCCIRRACSAAIAPAISPWSTPWRVEPDPCSRSAERWLCCTSIHRCWPRRGRYTLVDGYSVKTLLLSPILVEYAGNFFRLVVLSAGALRRRALLLQEYELCWKEASSIALLTPLGYILVLFAMRLAPISHVAPLREMSMLAGMYLGARFLSEGQLIRRIVGSVLIAGGVAALALG